MADGHLGAYVVGLQPDDRMPHDWLRMVARVFAAYRERPLEQSVVAYVTGLNVLQESFDPSTKITTVRITPGQTFIDDQFIGTKEDSFYNINGNYLSDTEEYCLVLYYQWINFTPPQEPKLELVLTSNVDEEQMLCLAKITLNADGSINIYDDKSPWYYSIISKAVKNAEVDGPEFLPYIIAIKGASDSIEGNTGEGTIDIGWAIDFHHHVGNNIGYNIRLSTDRQNNDALYINGNRIITEVDIGDPNNPVDPNDPGDTYITINNNITIIDKTDSHKACFTEIARNANNPPVGSSICTAYGDKSLNLRNYLDIDHPNQSTINHLKLTETPDLVLLNGHKLWHDGNLQTTGLTMMFLGYWTTPPITRPDGSSIQDGDLYFDTSYKEYFFYRNGNWENLAPIPRQYHFISTSDTYEDFSALVNPNFIIITVGGVVLSPAEYSINPSHDVVTIYELEKHEHVQIFTLLGDMYLSALDNPLTSSKNFRNNPINEPIQSPSSIGPKFNTVVYNDNEFIITPDIKQDISFILNSFTEEDFPQDFTWETISKEKVPMTYDQFKNFAKKIYQETIKK